jgi:hypothetical protein
MKRTEVVLRISEKLQKQMHLFTSQKMLDNPKMLCDNLAMRVVTELQQMGIELEEENESESV